MLSDVSLEELSGHGTVSDCWIAVYGKVYDVTRYLDEHPGRAADVLFDDANPQLIRQLASVILWRTYIHIVPPLDLSPFVAAAAPLLHTFDPLTPDC